jgi:hypothetical protein
MSEPFERWLYNTVTKEYTHVAFVDGQLYIDGTAMKNIQVLEAPDDQS